MVRKLSVDEIRKLGFEWPKYEIVAEYYVIEDGQIDLLAAGFGGFLMAGSLAEVWCNGCKVVGRSRRLGMALRCRC